MLKIGTAGIGAAGIGPARIGPARIGPAGIGPARIGSVTIDPPLLLAPMAGVTDRDFRLIVRRIGGVGLVAMEFIPAKGLARGERRLDRLMHFSDEERPIAIQIYGSDAATMAEAGRIVEGLGADVCDINMGCPANKVLKGCAGAALMGDLTLAEEIVAAVRRAITIPLTVKFRLGLDEGRLNFVELGRVCEANGVDAVALHARTARQMFRGEPRWPAIAKLKEALAIPVIGNGDVCDAGEALRMFRETGCDGVMIGRGATRDPWIFRRVAESLAEAGGPPDRRPVSVSLDERRALILSHFRTVIEREPRRLALHKLRTFTGWYSHGLPGGLALRRRIQQLPDCESFIAAIEQFFDDLVPAKAA